MMPAFPLQVSSWGGYVFLINLIPLHVLALMITGRFSHKIYVAYSTVRYILYGDLHDPVYRSIVQCMFGLEKMAENGENKMS